MKEKFGRRQFMTAASLFLAGLLGKAILPEKLSAEENQETTFDNLMAPFIAEAQKRRAERAIKDPEYAKRVDQELNENRVNFLLFSWGESFEPNKEKPDNVDVIGSQTILSYEWVRKTFELVSITHDTRGPEIERFLKEKGEVVVSAIKIDRAYSLGNEYALGGKKEGFSLQRLVLENATGLSVDFQIAFPDDVLVDMINTVFGKIQVDNPKHFQVNGCSYRRKLNKELKNYPTGIIEMNGLEAVCFIKTVPTPEFYPHSDLEHNVRKAQVAKAFSAYWQNIGTSLERSLFLGKMALFLGNCWREERIAFDFKPENLLFANLKNIAGILAGKIFDNNQQTLEPEVSKNLYIVDYWYGAGGVRWVVGDPNPITQKDLLRGVYADENMEVPYNGDPYAPDLVTDYWPSVRDLVKKTLSPPPTPEVPSDQPSY